MPLIDLFPEYGVRELARLTGLSHGTISRVKRGLAADRQTMQTLYSVTGKCLCCDGIANLSPTVQPEPAPAMGAEWMRREAVARLERQWPGPAKLIVVAIPGPTEADLLAHALAMPKIAALREAATDAREVYRNCRHSLDADAAMNRLDTAIAALKGGA